MRKRRRAREREREQGEEGERGGETEIQRQEVYREEGRRRKAPIWSLASWLISSRNHESGVHTRATGRSGSGWPLVIR